MPSLPKEAIAIDVMYLAVLLAHGRSLGLLPVIICSLLNGLRELYTEFTKVKTVVNDKGKTIYKTPNPRVKLAYTYVIVWLVLHCASLMMAPIFEDPASLPYVQRHEHSDWMNYYISAIHRAL